MIHDLIRVSVVVPTLNEAKNLPLIFPHIPLGVVDEVILVDGRSTDGTVDVARSLMPSVKVVLEPAPGKGAALRAGYRAATGDIIVVIDADGSNDPREIPRYLRSLIEGADFAKGSRFAHRGGTTDMPRFRQAGNRFFVMLVNLLFSSTFTDLCYGFHGFWRYCLDLIDIENVDGFEIDTALYVRAVRERLRIVEVPSFEGYRFYGEGKLRTFPDGIRVLRTIIHEWTTAIVAPRRQSEYLGFRGQLGSTMTDYSLTGPWPAATRARSPRTSAPSCTARRPSPSTSRSTTPAR
jgi:glycosyltransferase involved in cell wall biosynthesis